MEKVLAYMKSNPLVAILGGAAVLGITYHLFIKKKAVEDVVIGDNLEEAKSETKETLTQDEADKIAAELSSLIEKGSRIKLTKEGSDKHNAKVKELKSKLEEAGYKYENKKAVKKSSPESKPKESNTTKTTVISVKLSQADANKLAAIAKGIYDSAINGNLSNAQSQSVRQILADLSKAGYRYENGKAVPSGTLASNQVIAGTIGGQPAVLTKGGVNYSSDNADKII